MQIGTHLITIEVDISPGRDPEEVAGQVFDYVAEIPDEVAPGLDVVYGVSVKEREN